MRVLVTGAAGRVGANVVQRLQADNIDVRAMVLPGDPQRAKLDTLPDVEIVEADLTDQASVDSACRGVTHIVHLAAQLVRGTTPVDRFYDINALGTLRLLEGAVRSNASLERFVLASTDGTYRPGDPPALPLTEDSPQEPADYYGTSKLLGEIILRNHAAQYDIPFAIVRFATVVDPQEAANVFRVRFMRSVLERARLGKDTNIWQLFQGQPDLSQIFDEAVGTAPDNSAVGFVDPHGLPWSLHMLDVRDAVQGVYRALTVPGALGGVFNIAAATPTTYTDGASVLSELFNVPKIIVELPLRHRLEMTIDLARDVLGYEPRYDYRSMVQAARADGWASEDHFIPARVQSSRVTQSPSAR